MPRKPAAKKATATKKSTSSRPKAQAKTTIGVATDKGGRPQVDEGGRPVQKEA